MLLIPFLTGAVTFGFAAAALFFLRFWTRTRDELFLAFAAAFLLLAIQAGFALAVIDVEDRAWIYLIRLAAFMLIIVAIIRTNTRGK
ncbi:MAG: hypothetical protein JWL91_906 [Sphingomonas bacterium]|jgi:hypothetical protein|nr:DUF5985 family protein [Sphingomonas bacterium]MDB5689030.1 hypothetical protein [Sphingomonas bacterium]